jgi:hypothetical protein
MAGPIFVLVVCRDVRLYQAGGCGIFQHQVDLCASHIILTAPRSGVSFDAFGYNTETIRIYTRWILCQSTIIL